MVESKSKNVKSAAKSEREELSLLDLERLLLGKQTGIQALVRKRQRLENQLTEIENKLTELQPSKSLLSKLGLKFTFRTRPKNEKSLKVHVEEALKANRKGLTLQGLRDAVLASGYKTNSVMFLNTLYQCVYHAENIGRDEKTGNWKLI